MVSIDYTYFTFTRSCMLCICLCRRFGWAPEKCRQSARLLLQSSELRLPHPLTRRRVCSPLLWFGGGGIHITHSLGERGWGVPIQTRGQTLWYSRYLPIYALCVHRHRVHIFTRDETGLVYLLTGMERTLKVYW